MEEELSMETPEETNHILYFQSKFVYFQSKFVYLGFNVEAHESCDLTNDQHPSFTLHLTPELLHRTSCPLPRLFAMFIWSNFTSITIQ